jgi:hypothetical protein
MRITLGVTVEIATPGLLPDLIGRLAASGCVTSTIDEHVCHVVPVRATDTELHFFLRAWQAHHGVELSLWRDEAEESSAGPAL